MCSDYKVSVSGFTASTVSSRVPKPPCQASDLNLYVRKRHLPADISTIPVLKVPFCCRYAAIHASKTLLMWAQLCISKKTTWMFLHI